MISQPSTISSGPRDWIAQIIKVIALAFGGYWLAFAVVTPVTVWDSQTYNLGRLAVAQHGGLFGNHLWTSERQIIFPWSFDAVHLPFIQLGWGYALPSFLCLLSIAWMGFKILRVKSGERLAWLGVLALFALPTLVYQATSTKNDLALATVALFVGYGFWQFRQSGNDRRWLGLSAAALGFLPGIKNAGLPIAILLGLAGLWLLRREHRLLLTSVAVCAVSFILLGSAEVFANNVIVFGHPLGQRNFVTDHSNRDGVAGTIANLIRYFFGLMNFGWPAGDPADLWGGLLERGCLSVLHAVGLENVGYRPDFSDANLRFYKLGWEAASDFGLLGMITMLVAAARVCFVRNRNPAWWLALAGWACLGLTAATTGWMPWNNRFLLLPVLLFTGSIFLTLRSWISHSYAATGLAVLICLHGALAYPLYSFNKRPADLRAAVIDRESATLRERTSMIEVFAAIHSRQQQTPAARWLLHAGSDSWVFSLLTWPGLDVHLAPKLDAATLAQAQAGASNQEILVLVLNRGWTPPANAELIQRFQWESDSALYRLPAVAPVTSQ